MTAKLVGILNITPDSFSDGGQYNNINSALQHTQTLISEGADIIDIGAESTRPKAKLLSPQLEWQRLKPLLPQIIKLCHQCNIPVSLDTRHAINAKKGLDLGIDIINDVSGLSDMAMIQLIKSYHKPIIINHNLGLPANPNVTISENENPINIIMQWGKNKISALETQHHITKQNIIFDVGIGFGKTARQSLQILANIKTFKKLAVPIYVGHSRKSFLNLYKPTNTLSKDILTAYFATQITPYVDYIRVHNIAMTKTFIQYFSTISIDPVN